MNTNNSSEKLARTFPQTQYNSVTADLLFAQCNRRVADGAQKLHFKVVKHEQIGFRLCILQCARAKNTRIVGQ